MGMADIYSTVESGDIGTGMNSDAWNAYANGGIG
jgi:hypothetical protein